MVVVYIHAVNSQITVYCDRSHRQQASINFTENKAQRGGGICLESAAQMRIEQISAILAELICISHQTQLM